MKLKLEIKTTNGRWLVNGKQLHELNWQEKCYMNNFFREVKLSNTPDSIFLHNHEHQTVQQHYS